MGRRDKALEDAKEQLSGSVDRDRHLIQAVKLLEELGESRKPGGERFRQWYSLHFPELEQEISDTDELIQVLDQGIERDGLESFGEMAESSTGSPLPPEEREVLGEVREYLDRGRRLEDRLRQYIASTCEEVVPNLSELLGPVLAAKLLAHDGSLESLAKQPSSTIQMLGAEKALFRYLSGEGTPPKHGVLFEHGFVNSLPEDRRGKMARFLANKASIAARLDQYGDKRKGDKLRREARQKFEELQEEDQ